MALPRMVEDNTMKMVVMTCMAAKDKMTVEQAVDEYRMTFGTQVKDWTKRMRVMFTEAGAGDEILSVYDALIERFYGKRQ